MARGSLLIGFIGATEPKKRTKIIVHSYTPITWSEN